MGMLRLGRIDRIRIQVGYRDAPESTAYVQYLLDVPVPDPGDPHTTPFDTDDCLTVLEPLLYVGSDVPRHYSLHEHRWHTSWAPASGVVDLGLTVTTGDGSRATAQAAHDAVLGAFRSLFELADSRSPAQLTRDGALVKGRRGVAAAYGLDEDGLSLVSSEYQAAANAWRCGFRTEAFERYDVTVGFVDGHPSSISARLEPRDEVMDSLGTQ